MTIAELKTACEKSIAQAAENHLSQAHLVLVITRECRGGMTRLLGRSGPWGTIVGPQAHGRYLVDFDARVILRWIEMAGPGALAIVSGDDVIDKARSEDKP